MLFYTSIKWEELPKYVKPMVLDILICLSLKKSLNGSLTWLNPLIFMTLFASYVNVSPCCIKTIVHYYSRLSVFSDKVFEE